jgi:hypothetical protein
MHFFYLICFKIRALVIKFLRPVANTIFEYACDYNNEYRHYIILHTSLRVGRVKTGKFVCCTERGEKQGETIQLPRNKLRRRQNRCVCACVCVCVCVLVYILSFVCIRVCGLVYVYVYVYMYVSVCVRVRVRVCVCVCEWTRTCVNVHRLNQYTSIF